MLKNTTLIDFMELFKGRTDAYGTGKGQWIRKPPSSAVYQEHLEGRGHGLGIAPLLDDGTVHFAAIDLDEPDFEAAKQMQDFLSFGTTWVERSRSGNAHVWAFFKEPIEAWIARGVLREVTAALGKPTVEIFPKQDKLLEGMVGNYINLPYHGTDRLIQNPHGFPDWYPVSEFLTLALSKRNDPKTWEKRARFLGVTQPEDRQNDRQEFGTGKELHVCAEWIIANRDEVPVSEGHRNVVYFNLAKMLSHYEGIGHDEAWDLLCLVRDSADAQGIDHVEDSELRRILTNAERGGFTSTGCDDSLMLPYTHPDCPIAHPEKRKK